MNQDLKSSTITRAEYLEHIKAQKNSGLSTTIYCELHNLNLNRFHHLKSYRPVAKPKIKAINNFARVEIQTIENNLKLPVTKSEPLPAVKNDKVIDPVWLAKFIFTLSNCK